MRTRGWLHAALFAAFCISCSLSGTQGAVPAKTAVANPTATTPKRGNAWEATGPQGSKVGGTCVFTYKGKRMDYTYRLKAKTGAYLNGLMSPTGYYKLSVSGGQYTTYTYWWQFCGNMNFRTVTPLNRPVCGNNAMSTCPEACKDPNTKTCGGQCAGLMAQQYTNSQTAYCWALGQWAGGKQVSMSLFNPTDPTQGIIYTIKGGDSQGCAKKTKRSFSIAIQCPPNGGMSGAAVFPTTITDLGNCAYATTMVHPSACPVAGKGTAGYGLGHWLVLLAVAAFAVYFFGGMAFRYRQLGMRGVDMIPNLEFWRELPGVVVEGAFMAWGKFKELASAASGGRVFGETQSMSRYVSHAAAGFQAIA